MARSEARLQLGIWQDGLDGLGAHARLVYCVLLTERTVNHAGVGAIRRGKWSRNAALTPAELEVALAELQAGQYVLFDDDTDEFLIRTLIRNDGVADQPYLLKGALREALLTESRSLREALAAELRKLPPRRPDGVSKAGKRVVYPDPHATADQLESGLRRPAPETPLEDSTKDTGDPSETLFEGEGNPSVEADDEESKKGLERERGRGRGRGRGSVSSSSPSDKSRASKDSDFFDEFWSVYPRAEQKADARKAWGQQLRKGIKPERMINGARRFSDDCRIQGTEKRFIKFPAGWLRAEAFDDWQPEPQPEPDVREPEEILREHWRNADAQAVARILSVPFVDREPRPSEKTPRDEWVRNYRRSFIESHHEAAVDALRRRRSETDSAASEADVKPTTLEPLFPSASVAPGGRKTA